MADQFTSETGNRHTYRVKFEPGGEIIFVKASNAHAAGEAALIEADIRGIVHRGAFDVDYYAVGDDEDYVRLSVGQQEEE